MTQLTLEQVALDCFITMLRGYGDLMPNAAGLSENAFDLAQAFIDERNKRLNINDTHEVNKQREDILKQFAAKLANEQIDCPQEFEETFQKNYLNLLAKS